MDFGSIFQLIIGALVTIGLGALEIYVISYIKKRAGKIEDDNLRAAVEFAVAELDHSIRAAVHETEQTFVATAKEYDRWDQAAMDEAAARAFGRVKEITSDYAWDVAQYAKKSVAAYVKAQIEATIQEDK